MQFYLDSLIAWLLSAARLIVFVVGALFRSLIARLGIALPLIFQVTIAFPTDLLLSALVFTAIFMIAAWLVHRLPRRRRYVLKMYDGGWRDVVSLDHSISPEKARARFFKGRGRYRVDLRTNDGRFHVVWSQYFFDRGRTR